MPRLPRFYVYLLFSRENGLIYTGFTGSLRRRFREHNSPSNTGWTRGHQWSILAVKCFFDRDTALLFETRLKQSRYDKRNWIRRSAKVSARLGALCARRYPERLFEGLRPPRRSRTIAVSALRTLRHSS